MYEFWEGVEWPYVLQWMNHHQMLIYMGLVEEDYTSGMCKLKDSDCEIKKLENSET